MRSRFLVSFIAVLGLFIASPPALAGAGVRTIPPESTSDTYYVSLGDSLAAGYQPDSRAEELVSYTDRVFDALRSTDPHLQHVRLGCTGETTATMISGGRCSYVDAASQLDAATAFLAAHPGRVRFVTVDIGANDVFGCLTAATASTGSVVANAPDLPCLRHGLTTIRTNLARIDARLRSAGGTTPRYVGMNYYDPALRGWLDGTTGKVLAQLTAVGNQALSATIRTTNSLNGFATADVKAAFSNGDLLTRIDVPGIGTLPKNVARICQWTWACSRYSDIHANPTGHQVIADTVLRLLR